MSSIKGAWQELLVLLGLDLGLVFMVFWSILVLWWDRLGFGCVIDLLSLFNYTRLTGESGAAGGSAEDRRRRPRKSAGCVWWRRVVSRSRQPSDIGGVEEL